MRGVFWLWINSGLTPVIYNSWWRPPPRDLRLIIKIGPFLFTLFAKKKSSYLTRTAIGPQEEKHRCQVPWLQLHDFIPPHLPQFSKHISGIDNLSNEWQCTCYDRYRSHLWPLSLSIWSMWLILSFLQHFWLLFSFSKKNNNLILIFVYGVQTTWMYSLTFQHDHYI